ncbi:hypothetical protein SARC_06711 [Sphaeroforma arctica JP610]|uniref:Uncharacterized protein n=1 Tax=Sphaeroforma arctica JP610 TaxID=667725 RepID=A0A0L0FWK6_9EUKA|nr:hypothetical protein SARC_06711 [Sphaeroforma arctica JP610]KNC80946.1 hypothetical protein SARC_06711 [Sphaeroforma arctica JP610]|eukprot:XP_014154848.1 hypothetical protein SARC_06711 [Sphaeroforma arctica JP610]
MVVAINKHMGIGFANLVPDLQCRIMQLLHVREWTELSCTSRSVHAVSQFSCVEVAVLANTVQALHLKERFRISEISPCRSDQLRESHLFVRAFRSLYTRGGCDLVCAFIRRFGTSRVLHPALVTASGLGYADVVDRLHNYITTSALKFNPLLLRDALCISAWYGHIDVMKLLLQLRYDCFPASVFGYDESVEFACVRGYTEVLQLLLKDGRCNPGGHGNYAIGLATAKGHTDIVRLLLGHPRVEIPCGEHWAIRRARAAGHSEILQLLEGAR